MNAYDRYCFFFAHPDDEIYSCALIRRLVHTGKRLLILYATSGDGAGFPEKREQEARDSLAHCGITDKDIRFLRIPEHHVLSHLKQLISLAVQLSRDFQADCLIGHDYEGGHEAHDALCYCSSELVKKNNIPHFYTFPLYHGKPQERQGARFKASRTDFLSVPLSDEEAQLKRDVLATHASQFRHFEGLQRSAPDYMELLCNREVFYKVQQPIDFSKRPMEEVGYEFHRNGFTFQDFQAAIHL
ncbi:MAG: PIG-L family deacetylase [Bacteroidota bacterium]